MIASGGSYMYCSREIFFLIILRVRGFIVSNLFRCGAVSGSDTDKHRIGYVVC